MRLFIIIYFISAVSTLSSAQKLLKQLTTDEGLSEIKCFDIFQGSEGYMWIGTSAGANKYDGKDVISFERSSGLLSNHIYSFHEDSKKRIWINNLNGEPIYVKDNIVHNRHTDPHLEDIKTNRHFVDVVEDKFNRVWFVQQKNIKILDQDSIFNLSFPEFIDSLKFELFGVFQYKNEMILATTFHFRSIDPKTFETNWSVPIKELNSYSRKVLHNDKLYLFNLSNAFVFDLKTREFKTIKRTDGGPPIYDCRVLYNEVLVSTSIGVSIVRDSILENYEIHPSIDSISISAVHEDSQGALWIATLKNGVYFYYNCNVEDSKYSDFCNINLIEKYSEDSIFIGQEDWTVSLIDNEQVKWKKSLVKVDENRINNVFYKDGELWIADKHYLHIDVEGDYKTFKTYSRKVHFDDESDKYIWIGTQGISILDDINIIFKYADMYDMMESKIDSPEFYIIHNPSDFKVVNDREIWVGGEAGLFHILDGEMERMTNPELNGSITALRIKDGHIIGVNYGNGIFDYNLATGQAEMLTRENGLPSNYFTHLDINEDDIWVSHAAGLCLLSKDEQGLRHVKNFDREHGIPEGSITLLKVIDNVCHFVVNGHAYSIKPDQNINDTLNILLDTSAITYFTGTSQSVNFDCINFAFADKIQYEYRLVPLDTVWEEVNDEKIDLEYIPAGEYELEVRAKHPLNLINPIKRKPITVEERWYNENYFRCMVLLFIGFIFFFLFRIKALSFNTANFKHWVASKIQKYFVKEERNSFNLKDINGVVHLLNTNEIKFIKSSGNYLEYHTDERKYVARMTMSKAVENFKMWADMERVHRSYMVNFSMIEAIDHNFLKVGNIDIPFTDRYRDVIERKLKL